MTHKLLLADDSVTIQRVVELTFSGEDMQVITVGDGEQAIARIPIERPDIVLADIGMPKRSGYDVAAFVKGRPDLCHIPVLLLAGAFEPVDDARAQQVRCDGVLVKPFEPQQVVSRVRELVDGARERLAQVIPMPSPQPVAACPYRQARRAHGEFPGAGADHESRSRNWTTIFRVLTPRSPSLDTKVESRPHMPLEMDDFRAPEVPTLEKLLGSAPLHDPPGSAEPSYTASRHGGLRFSMPWVGTPGQPSPMHRDAARRRWQHHPGCLRCPACHGTGRAETVDASARGSWSDDSRHR